MLADHRIRFTWMALLLCILAFAGKPQKARASKPLPPPPFPSAAINRLGYNGGSPSPLCCESRLIGWTASGSMAVLSSEFSPEQQIFRYAIDLHDPAFMDPDELFSTTFFVSDDSLPMGCEGESDPLRCVWKRNQQQIGDLLRMHGVDWSPVRMRPVPNLEIQFVPDPLGEAGGGASSVSFFDFSGRLLIEMPDTTDPGLRLSPLGTIVRNRPTPKRYMVMRMYSREVRNGPPRERGVRFLNMN